MTSFVDAAGVSPAVFQPIFLRLTGTEPQFGISCFALAHLLFDIIKGDLVVLEAPGVGQDGVGGGRRRHIFAQWGGAPTQGPPPIGL